MTVLPTMPEEGIPPGRRARKKRATRLALRAAAIDLCAERGFAHVTVEDIAGAVDVSVRTFFNYFDSKEAALVGNDPEFIETMRAELLDLPRDLPPLEALRLVIMARTRAVTDEVDGSDEERAQWLRRLAVVRGDPALAAASAKHMAAVERELTDALVAWLGGEPRTAPYAALLAVSVMGALRVASMCWSDQGGRVPLGEITSAALDALGRGLTFELPGDEGAPPTAARLFGAGPGEPGRSPNGRLARSVGVETEQQ
jgi:AcrR family transcriptional regulator